MTNRQSNVITMRQIIVVEAHGDVKGYPLFLIKISASPLFAANLRPRVHWSVLQTLGFSVTIDFCINYTAIKISEFWLDLKALIYYIYHFLNDFMQLALTRGSVLFDNLHVDMSDQVTFIL